MFRKITYIIAAALFVLLGYFVFAYVQYNNERASIALEKGQETTTLLRDDVEAILEDVMASGEEIAALMVVNTFSKKEIEDLIVAKAVENPNLLGVTIAFEPYKFKEDINLYAPYYDKRKNSILQLGELYDYTDTSLETTAWYSSIETQGAQWVEPYYAQGAEAFVSDYSLPIRDAGGAFIGVVSMTISLQGFTDLIHSISLGKTGFGFVSSAKGEILAHPISEYNGTKTISDLSRATSIPQLVDAYDGMFRGETGNVSFIDPDVNQKTLLFYDKVPVSSWRIGVQFFTEDLLGYDTKSKRNTINIAIAGSLLFFCLLGIFFNRDYLSVKEIWILSIVGSVVLIANIFLIGYVEHTSQDEQVVSESPPVTDNTTLSSIINAENLKTETLGLPDVAIVPTGIYVDELSFEDSYNVNLSGIVWQKYNKAIVDSVNLGFKFPQASPFAESVYIEERYREIEETYVLIGYDFRLTAKLNFVYSKYPFDKRNLNLEIQPINHNDNLLFVPDLDSYDVTNPSQKSGISSNVSLSGNEILESYFSYHYFSYDTDFGYDSVNFKDVPELHYNINLKRVLINAFVTYLIPIFVTLLLLFIMVYATNKSATKITDTGIVQGMTAFFFVLVFSHIDLRKNIETAELIYMEYFYFITYIMIILTTYNLILYTRPEKSKFDWQDNLIIKSIYWPTFLILVLAVSLAMFY